MFAKNHIHENKRFLVVVTAGGYTNAAPLIEIASILAARGHVIDFGVLNGHDQWLINLSFVSQVHVLGPALSAEVEEANYLVMSRWSSNLISNWDTVFATRQFLESSWPQVYHSLTHIMTDLKRRPDFILADYLVDAARDMCIEYDVPLAMHWPQMPTAMLSAPYIPGTAGLQIEVLTSEYASLWQRLRSTLAIYTSLPYYLRYLKWVKQLRASEGVTRQLPALNKPNYLCLVNSFFGLEAAKDIPPNVAAIGPVLADAVPVLVEPFNTFVTQRSRVLYIALGTHVLLPHNILIRLLNGIIEALASRLIDGVVWAIRAKARRQLDRTATIVVPSIVTHELSRSTETPTSKRPISSSSCSSNVNNTMMMSVAEILDNGHPSIFVTDFAPQRSLLHHPSTAIFLSHAGASSTNEAAFSGTPLITLAVYFDQIQNSMRLRDAGVAIPLNKDRFTAQDVTEAIATIMQDIDAGGPTAINMKRVQGIAQIASRRKTLAADLIEEHLADWEGRRMEREYDRTAKRTRGMHLETADQRLPFWKARNWDLWTVLAGSCLLLGGAVATAIAVPLSL